ncbi:hypothetical protein [uncultured Eudoraea sp.]|uniref:hypothetical protein n=1 Tax=uncultured Eudoraea sp. TaxID=1035614 RepID=UPI002612A881|nr:hypothetical protein [uncultured Eudoraea sp.]
MKTFFKAVLTMAVLLALSCTQESVTDGTTEDLTATAVRAGKKVDRPIKNSIVSIDKLDGSPTTFTGNMSHLGKITGTVGTGIFDLNFVTGIGLFTSAPDEDIIYAANGDELHTQSVLTFIFSEDFLSATYMGYFDFTEGSTGRFDGATGRMYINNGVYMSSEDENGNPIDVYTHNAAGRIIY